MINVENKTEREGVGKEEEEKNRTGEIFPKWLVLCGINKPLFLIK